MKARHASLVAVALSAVASCGGGSPSTTAKPAATPTKDAAAEPRTGPWLWKVTKGNATSYIFGLPPSGVMAAEIPPPVWEALGQSSRLFVTAEPTEEQMARFQAGMLLPEGDLLADFLEPDEWEHLKPELAPTVQADALPRLRVATAIFMLSAREIPLSDAVSALRERHRAAGREVVGVDVVEIDTGPWTDDARWAPMLRDWSRNLEARRRDSYLDIERYRSGDSDVVRDDANAHIDGPEAEVELLEIDAWMKQLEPALAGGGVFAVLSPWRVLQKNGYLERLQRGGFTVERVALGTPVVVAGKATRFVTRDDCRGALDHMVDLVAKARPDMDRAELAGKIQPADMYFCLAQSLDAVACWNAAASVDAYLACVPVAEEQPGD